MQTQSQEIRHDQNSAGPAGGQARYRFGKVGRALLEECGFDHSESALLSDTIRYLAHSLVRRFDARPVSEDGDPRLQAPWTYAFKCRSSSSLRSSSNRIRSRIERKPATCRPHITGR